MPAKPAKSPAYSTCPCQAGVPYADCCGRYHGGQPAPDAEALMRSRYSAYVLDLHDYLFATWAAEARPATLENAPPRPQWQGLKVLAHRPAGDAAEVEFIARYKLNGRALRLHEISRFVRSDGRWYYVDGVFPDQTEV